MGQTDGHVGEKPTLASRPRSTSLTLADITHWDHFQPMLSLFAFVAAASTMSGSCPGQTTLQVNACFGARLTESDRALNRYNQAALKRARQQKGSETAHQLMQSERSWVAYRNAECGSVFDYWRGGTIRVSSELDCRILLTRLRTYAIWRDWLTYPDNTPPLLPRPNIGPATAEH
jgi:uncharacterized protein YecT (DUF1311 family)